MTDDYPLTQFLIATNSLIFIVAAVSGSYPGVLQQYTFSMEQIWQGQLAAVITSGFLHSDVPHLLYNMFFLWVFGRACEAVFGTWRTAGIYITAMAAGSLFFGLLFPEQTAVGSSGAVSGLVAAAILTEPGRDIYPTTGAMPIVVLAVLFLIPTVLNAFNLANNTANIAHVGGAFGGAVLTYMWRPDQAWKNMRELWPLWTGIGVVVLLLIVQVIL